MFLNDAEFKSYFDFQLILECSEIVLKQQVKGDPKTYRGPGSIALDETGSLNLKMYHRFKTSAAATKDFADEFNAEISPGKLIGSEHYYNMVATDLQGRIWTAKGVRLYGHSSMPTAMRMIKATLKTITNTRKHASKPKWFSFFVSPIRTVPFTEFRRVGNKNTLSKCTLNFSKKECEILRHDGYDEVSGKVPKNKSALEHGKLILNALSISSGAYVKPRIRAIGHPKKTEFTLYSSKRSESLVRLQEPFPCFKPEDLAKLQQFAARYVSHFNSANNPMFGYWFRIARSAGDEIENMALVICTCIEGVLKEYFPDMCSPDEEYLKQVTDAKKVLKKAEIGERIKQRLLSSMDSKNTRTANNALYRLQSLGVLPDDLVEAWRSLRNKAAHAAKIEQDDVEIQKMLDDYYSCLELFYVLMMQTINYNGVRYSLSKPHWPEIKFSPVSTVK